MMYNVYSVVILLRMHVHVDINTFSQSRPCVKFVNSSFTHNKKNSTMMEELLVHKSFRCVLMTFFFFTIVALLQCTGLWKGCLENKTFRSAKKFTCHMGVNKQIDIQCPGCNSPKKKPGKGFVLVSNEMLFIQFV